MLMVIEIKRNSISACTKKAITISVYNVTSEIEKTMAPRKEKSEKSATDQGSTISIHITICEIDV